MIFFQKKQKQLKDPFDLANYLLTPIQRLAKYPLFLTSLVKECAKNEFHVKELEDALTMMQKFINKGNDLISLEDVYNCKVSRKICNS